MTLERFGRASSFWNVFQPDRRCNDPVPGSHALRSQVPEEEADHVGESPDQCSVKETSTECSNNEEDGSGTRIPYEPQGSTNEQSRKEKRSEERRVGKECRSRW